MECDLLYGLMRTAVEHKVLSLDDDWIKLAEVHSVKMLNEIKRILEKNITSDEKINQIMKIIYFVNVPPHTIK